MGPSMLGGWHDLTLWDREKGEWANKKHHEERGSKHNKTKKSHSTEAALHVWKATCSLFDSTSSKRTCLQEALFGYLWRLFRPWNEPIPGCGAAQQMPTKQQVNICQKQLKVCWVCQWIHGRLEDKTCWRKSGLVPDLLTAQDWGHAGTITKGAILRRDLLCGFPMWHLLGLPAHGSPRCRAGSTPQLWPNPRLRHWRGMWWNMMELCNLIEFQYIAVRFPWIACLLLLQSCKIRLPCSWEHAPIKALAKPPSPTLAAATSTISLDELFGYTFVWSNSNKLVGQWVVRGTTPWIAPQNDCNKLVPKLNRNTMNQGVTTWTSSRDWHRTIFHCGWCGQGSMFCHYYNPSLMYVQIEIIIMLASTVHLSPRFRNGERQPGETQLEVCMAEFNSGKRMKKECSSLPLDSLKSRCVMSGSVLPVPSTLCDHRCIHFWEASNSASFRK